MPIRIYPSQTIHIVMFVFLHSYNRTQACESSANVKSANEIIKKFNQTQNASRSDGGVLCYMAMMGSGDEFNHDLHHTLAQIKIE